jgi:hypothetical protein
MKLEGFTLLRNFLSNHYTLPEAEQHLQQLFANTYNDSLWRLWLVKITGLEPDDQASHEQVSKELERCIADMQNEDPSALLNDQGAWIVEQRIDDELYANALSCDAEVADRIQAEFQACLHDAVTSVVGRKLDFSQYKVREMA